MKAQSLPTRQASCGYVLRGLRAGVREGRVRRGLVLAGRAGFRRRGDFLGRARGFRFGFGRGLRLAFRTGFDFGDFSRPGFRSGAGLAARARSPRKAARKA
jgi:hypothetical protein